MSTKFPLDDGGEEIILFGIPFDSTSSFLPGSRFAPQAIRQAAWSCEPYDVFERKPISPHLRDVGDTDVCYGNARRTLEIAEAFLHDFRDKRLMAIGGEHTISLAPIHVLEPDIVICLDAHLDLRDEYQGEKYSHATVMRRVSESCEVGIFGFREACGEELEYARKNGIQCVSVREPLITPEGKKAYVSIDLDVIEGAYVGNPSPGGLSYWQVYDFLREVFGKNDVCGIDVVEAISQSPDTTAVAAARLLFSASMWWK
jgi:agmatinase